MKGLTQSNHGKLAVLSPYRFNQRWLSTSGNQRVLRTLVVHGVKLQRLTQPEIGRPRIIFVESPARGGLTALLNQFESCIKRNGQAVLSLQQGTEADERYILSNLVEEIRLPIGRWSEFSSGLSPLQERVFFLRNYDSLIIHDIQRFLYFTPRVNRLNSEALVYLLDTFCDCQLVLGGSTEAIDFYADILKKYSQLRLSITPMELNQQYIDFVLDVGRRTHPAYTLSTQEIESVFESAQGLVGETLDVLNWLNVEKKNETKWKRNV